MARMSQRRPRDARAWLRRSVANTFANSCRKRQREVAQVLRPELDASLPACEYSSARSEEEVLAQFAHAEAGRPAQLPPVAPSLELVDGPATEGLNLGAVLRLRADRGTPAEQEFNVSRCT
jgi:hypothetical protein